MLSHGSSSVSNRFIMRVTRCAWCVAAVSSRSPLLLLLLVRCLAYYSTAVGELVVMAAELPAVVVDLVSALP